MPSVDWGSSTLQFTGAQRVYTRRYWADAWTLQGNLWCNNASWSLLPSVPVADLELQYGYVLPHGGTSWTTQSKLAIEGYYVKIEYDAADGTLEWIGYIDEVADEQGGIVNGVASGTQRFVAYHLVNVLSHHYITRDRWYDEPNSAARWSGSAIAFNADGKPNRTETAPAGESGPIFAARHPTDGFDVANYSASKYWSTREILQYLEDHQQPLDNTGANKIPWAWDDLSAAPDWDQPQIQTEGRSLLDIVQELAGPSRLLQISAEVDDGTTPNTLKLKLHSLVGSSITLGTGISHPANPDTLTLTTWAAQDTNVTVQNSLSRRSVQVVVKGAKRQAVASLRVGGSSDDEGLVRGWSGIQELDYENAASAEPDYSGMSDSEKREANERARARTELADVFRTFVMNPLWSFTIAGEYLFQTDDDIPEQYYPYWSDLRFRDVLPLKDGDVDYANPTTETGPFPKITFDDDHIAGFRDPYVVFERDDTLKYIDVEKMANGDDPKFSCYVGIAKEDKAVTLDVTGAFQHAIANDWFNGLPVDDEDYGNWDFEKAFFTFAIGEDRYCEASYPADADLPTVDVVRRKIIYAGDAYQRILVAPNTIYDTETNGTVKYVRGGQSVPEFRDDRQAIEAVAKIADGWHNETRKVLRLVSARPTATAAVGQLVTTINQSTAQQETINSIVSEISIRTPRGRDLPIATAEYTLTTAIGELDPLAFVPDQERVA